MLKIPYSRLLTEVGKGNRCVMLTHLDFKTDSHGSITSKVLISSGDIAIDNPSIDAGLYYKICGSLETGMPQLVRTEQNAAILIEAFIPYRGESEAQDANPAATGR
jgi:hypothetical protein